MTVVAGDSGRVAEGKKVPFSTGELGVVLGFLLLFTALSIWSPVFLTPRNLLNIVDQWAPIALIACAGTLVIMAGGFDLSAGATFALAGILSILATNAAGPIAGIVTGLGVGFLIGLINALLTTVGKVNTFIGTLATAIIGRGIATAITGGFIVSTDSEGFAVLGTARVFGIQLSAYILALTAIACTLVVLRTPVGRHILACGGNPEAARLSGVSVHVTRGATFVISGLLAALAGLMVASQVGSVQSTTGVGIEFTAIAAVVIGGNSIFGGEGAIWRTVVGVFILAMIGNGFTLLGLNPTYQDIVKGLIILTAVGLDAWTRKKI
ncbi:ABC transporter permease [Mesorhizobium sp. M1329]|uniref:ABC transporter permease n=1 Tax=Mesorhizobium sp. M1329 TaxID=2957083 RepID=UPI00333B45D8